MNSNTNIYIKTIVNKAWNTSKGRFEFSFVFAFQDRAQYLDFRLLWKQNYAGLSTTIRAQKALIKATMRKREHAGKLQSEQHNLSAEATLQVLMLSAAKREANSQYLAAKQMAAQCNQAKDT